MHCPRRHRTHTHHPQTRKSSRWTLCGDDGGGGGGGGGRVPSPLCPWGAAQRLLPPPPDFTPSAPPTLQRVCLSLRRLGPGWVVYCSREGPGDQSDGDGPRNGFPGLTSSVPFTGIRRPVVHGATYNIRSRSRVPSGGAADGDRPVGERGARTAGSADSLGVLEGLGDENEEFRA